MRNIDANTLASLDSSSLNMVSMVAFYDIGGTNTYLTDGPVDITYDGNTYTATRGVMSVGSVTEDTELRIESLDIGLSAIDSENVKLFLDYNYIDRRVVVHRGVTGADYNLIGDPILVFDGRLDQPRVSEDFKSRKADLAVSASSHWANFDEAQGRHTNNTEQQVLFPGDTFFQFTTQTQKDVKWGKE